MAIKRSFSGTLLRKPGAYSTSRQDKSGGTPLGANGILLIVGESEKGAPGDQEGYQRFNSSQFSALVAEFGSGPIVDVAKVALVPSRTPGIGGADEFVIWKTNSSTKAELDLSQGSTDIIKLKDKNWGDAGNRISVEIVDGSSSNQKVITIRQNADSEILSENAALAQLDIQYTGSAGSCSLTISGSLGSEILATDSGVPAEALSISLSSHSMQSLAELINSNADYAATLKNTQSGSITPALDLDPVTIADIKTSVKDLFRLQEELVDIINSESGLVEAEFIASDEGLPSNISQTFLTGGAKGASASSDFSDGFNNSLAEEWNVAIPAISRDASDDISDDLTDSASSYDIDSVQAAFDAHLRLRGSIKNRKEAQGMVGRRDSTIADSYTASQTLASELIQMCVQDVLVVDISGELKWKQPHVMAGLMAGIRLGSEVGEPLTHKFISANGAGHIVDSNGLVQGDFNPETDFVAAIDAGILFSEQANSGNRIVVDNTTYGADQSFVFNRGSVVEASQFVAKTLRQTAELVFVGQKVSLGIAGSIKSVLTNKLIELFDAAILSPSDDAPQGFVEETFVVEVEGNTANVSLEIKPVQGLDYVLIEFTLGDVTQSA